MCLGNKTTVILTRTVLGQYLSINIIQNHNNISKILIINYN